MTQLNHVLSCKQDIYRRLKIMLVVQWKIKSYFTDWWLHYWFHGWIYQVWSARV